jgi:hypothetical protein
MISMGRMVSGWSVSTRRIRSRSRSAADRRTIAIGSGGSGLMSTSEYQDAATLLADFWTAVDAVLRERGVIP